VFTRSGSTWTQQGSKLTPTTGYNQVGQTVALSADGNTALLGAPYRSTVWVYTRSGATWMKGPSLVPSDATSQSQFGSSLALSADGSAALIGGLGDGSVTNAPGQGAAWLFGDASGSWAQQGPKLTPADGIGASAYGRSVSLSGDGGTALVGGDGDNGQVGAAWVVSFTDPTNQIWGTRYATSGDDRPAGDVFSSDGSTLFVTGSGGTNMVTIAYNASSGAMRWSRVFANGSGKAVALSSDGSKLYVTGQSPGSGGHLDYVTIAYDMTTGNLIWSKRYDSAVAHLDDVPAAITVSPDGTKLFVTGSSNGGSSGEDYATIAYDASTGAQLWAVRFNSSFGLDDTAAAIAVSPDGSRVFVTGSSASSTQGRDYATAAYTTSNGALQWVARFSSSHANNDDPSGIAVTSDGSKVIVTGESPGTATAATGFRATTLAFAASNGSRLWEVEDFAEPSGSYRPRLTLNSDGSTAFVTDTVTGASSLDFGTVAYATSNGSRRWTTTFNGPDGLDDSPTAIAVSPDGNRLYVAGSTGSPSHGKDFLTAAYSAGASFHFFWSRRNNGAGNGDDVPNAVAAASDSSKLAVAGSSVGTSTGNDWSVIAYRAS
jgi:DNA-binding beta-propeller fold protein YncE